MQGARVARHGGGVLPLPLRWHRVAGGALDRSACPRVRARTAAVPVDGLANGWSGVAGAAASCACCPVAAGFPMTSCRSVGHATPVRRAGRMPGIEPRVACCGQSRAPQTLPCAVMVARARCGDGGPGAYVCGRPHMGIACLQQAVVAPEAAPLVLLPCQACGLCRVPRIATGACAEVAGVWPVCACRVDQASRGSVACMRCAGQKKRPSTVKSTVLEKWRARRDSNSRPPGS